MHALRVATRINPDLAEYWAFLVQAYAKREHGRNKAQKQEKADTNRKHSGSKTQKQDRAQYQEFIFETIIDFASEVQKEEYKQVLRKTQEAACLLDHSGITCTRIKELEDFLDMAYLLEIAM